ncbi:MAG TPA: M17 family peptidase N-terminal domain-containing protein, partial [Rubrobacteraceae bacterium]|nr:M17 family peptidase N-terminal domain-containing protein [Rubrobacteraceae bacterium]
MIGATGGAAEDLAAEMLAVGLFKGQAPEGLGDAAAKVVSSGDFTGKEGETALLYGQDGLGAARLLLLGLGERERFDLERLRRASATAAKRARNLKLHDAAFSLPLVPGAGVREAAQAAAEGASLGLYHFDRHKSGTERHELETFELVSDEKDLGQTIEGAEIGQKAAWGASLARDLANEPSNVATPEYLAQKAREIAERHDMEVTVLDRSGIEEEGLTGLATVGRSAANDPRFIVLEHRKGGDAAPIVLVGKAVTFDSGGISIKPSAGMENMKFDMSGGAAVLGAMEAVGDLDLPLNVVALLPATENLPGGDAFKPGDVL